MIFRNKGYNLLAAAICMAAVSFPTHAWRSYGGGSASGRFGGSASWSHSSAGGAYGGWGHSSGTYTGPHGNSASWSHSSYGGYHPPAYGGYHPPAYGYHPPAYYGSSGYSSGDVAAAGIAGLAVGAMAGAAAASRPAPAPTTVVVQQPMAPAPLMLGTSLTYLPGGCVNINISSGQYYECGANWFKPYFGSNGVYYQVVPAPY
jgi:hypothetical protein